MPNENLVVLAGRLTRDPEVRQVGQSGSSVCHFGMAINRKYRGRDQQQKDETTFVDITCWGKQAETCGQHLRKGSAVMIRGRLRFESWVDQSTQQNKSKLSVVAESVQFMTMQQQQPPQQQQNWQAPGQQWQPPQQQHAPPYDPGEPPF